MANPANLKVLARARALSIEIHRVFRDIHVPVNPDLKSQLLRSAASISRNIAEGCGRPTPTQFGQFLGYSIGSANELEECLLQVDALGVLPRAKVAVWLREVAEVRMMLYGLRKRVEGRIARSAPENSVP